MTDPVSIPKALIIPSAVASRELASFAETGLITPEQQKALTVATNNLTVMKAVSTPIGARHFNRIDTLLAVRISTPVSQARECLSTLATAWDSMSADFHKFRELYFEVRLRRAKLNQKRKLLATPQGDVSGPDALDEDARIILEAEIELEAARIDKIEADVAKGHAAIQGQVQKATSASDQYALILKQSGKTEFTEDDFRSEEIDYYLQSAWWHVSMVYNTVDVRNKWKRPQGPPRQEDEEEDLREMRKHRRIDVKHEVVMYFQGLGISQREIEAELQDLLGQRESFDMVNQTMSRNANPQSFAGHFDGWVKRTAQKYRDRAVVAIKSNGFDRIKRIAAISRY